ncbi:DNA topoisomerase 2-binding protein 1 isoform X1 [Camellia sinensis]|uniref:DNA topoisomerase 2-binding protein 1 isoform X1 n=2 Tax=Camellia sinensis TaxID=4442 RepID=UPI0010356BD5|nr:DNA topoisomerase 2-binding protein 1 isoform X1 [Camellia sinensis]
MMSKTFEGANVFMSRNLVPPEIFDSLHDSLKHNGAKLFLCSDPSRNGPDDFHVISSTDHEKFELLQKKGCNLLGPQCVLSCAKEHRPLPKQGFTCCLAMDGVKVLASGFEMDEKLEIGKMVTAMGGVLHAKTSLDVSFVIVKNVLAAKYKWALNVLKKPIVTLNWLHQCWKEHRIVSQESYRVLPFSGLTVCVTRIPADERREMEKVVVQNGGKYSAELTKKCTHLVCDAPEGDKYKVAKRWGHIHIVTRKWFDQSVSRRVCLNEESYPVQGGSSSSINGMRTCLLARRSQDKGVGNSQCAPSSVAGDSNLETVLCGGIADPELEATLSQNVSTTFSDTSIFVKEESGALAKQPKSDTNFDGCVADDSQNEDNDLYLSDCRILLLGFDASEMRKLVNMVRRGGGSRYMSFNEKLTHIVVGTPLEIEKKEVRGLAALGVIYVVRTVWLEDCDRTKKEVPVLQRHIAYELLLPKDPVCSNKGATMGIAGMKQGKASAVQSILPDDQLWGATNSGSGTPLDKNDELKVNLTEDSSLRPTVRSDKHIQFCAFNGKDKDPQKTQRPSCNEILDVKSLNVFKGKLFRFASSFPQARRAEIIQWVNQGGGAVVDEQTEQNAHFTVECHGVVPSLVDVSRTTHISSHWIRSCLEDGCLLDVRSHILYSPLPCRVPFPGFERFRFCVSQYDEKDRLLLRNLCFILGARFVEKLTKKVTHLLCKFTNGPKYEAACKWQIQTVTCEWIYECIKQSEVVAPGSFCPKKVTSQDREAGLCTLSQYPTQATRMISGDDASQFPSQSQDPRNIQSRAIGTSDNSREEAKFSSICGKRARLFEEDIDKGILSSGSNHSDPTCKMTSTGNNIPRNTGEVSNAVPDVAAAIEDLLAQTSKIHDLKSPGSIECDKNLFSSDCSILGQDQADPHSAFVLSKHWINRADRKDDVCDPSGDRNAGMYDGFSETQTESQVVGYEEDLSGRQMIIDRVRTRSSMI